MISSILRLPIRMLPVVALAVLAACAPMAGPVGNLAVPQPAKNVEPARYLGRWYELGRYEAPFQRDCEAVTADYSLREDGKIGVLNSCHKGTVNGPLKTAKGTAKIADTTTNAKLKVSFFGPIYGDYWILDRAEDYGWAIVGEPSGRYLWMLSRTANPDATMRKTIENRVREMGYDWSLVRPTQQAESR